MEMYSAGENVKVCSPKMATIRAENFICFFGSVFGRYAGMLLVVKVYTLCYFFNADIALNILFGGSNQILRRLQAIHLLQADSRFPNLRFSARLGSPFLKYSSKFSIF